MAEFPSLPLFTDAFLADTGHLNAAETGAYLLLLMMAWRSRDCRLPDDDAKLARWARVDGRTWARLKPKVMEFWTLSDGGWSQKRLLKERGVVSKRAEVARQNGALGGRPKQLKNNDQENPAGSPLVTQKKAPNPISRRDDDDDACARASVPVSKSLISETAHAVADQVREAINADRDDPRFFGLAYRAQYWLDKGFDREAIVIAARTVAGRKRDGPPSLAYLEKAIPGEVAKLTQPAADVVTLPAHTVTVNQSPRAITVRDQAQQETQDVLRQLREFASGSSGGSGANPRLLRHDPGQ